MTGSAAAAVGGGLGIRHRRVQRLRRLAHQVSFRAGEKAFVLEGAKLLAEALIAGAPIEGVYVAPGTSDPVVDRAADAGIRVFKLGAGVLERVSGTTTPQPVVAVCGRIDRPLDTLRGASLVVACVDVRDPGNLGTILRSAEAAGADGVVCCDGTVDPYNPKTVRATAGALFHVPLVAGGNAVSVLSELGALGMRRLASRRGVSTAARYDLVDLSIPVCIVLGNEASGLPAHIDDHVDGAVTIPIAGRSESLNVGMAGAVLCFEAARQRREKAEAGV